MWETQHNIADKDCFKTLLLQQTWKTRSQHQLSYFSRCRFTHGWDSRSRSLGFRNWSISFLTKLSQQNQRCQRATGKPVGIPTTNTNPDLTNIDHVPSRGTHYLSNALLYVFEELGQGREKVPIGNVYSSTEKKDFLSVYVDDIKLAKKQNIEPMWKVHMKDVDLDWHRSLIMYTWAVLKENVRQAKRLWTNTGKCLNPKSLQELWKSCPSLRNWAQTIPHGPMTWKVMQRSAWNDIANWGTKQLNNYTKSQHHAFTTTNSRNKTWDLLDNCQKFAQQLFWNVYIWHVSGDLIFNGLWTILLMR